MKSGFFSSMTALLVGTSLALAQAPTPTGPAPVPTTVPPPVAVLPPGSPGPVISPVEAGVAEPAGGTPVLPRGEWVNDLGQCFFVHGEYLLWRLSNAPLPGTNLLIPLTLNFPPATANLLGTSTAVLDVTNQPLFPTGTTFDGRDSTGVRISAGFWLDPSHDCSLEGTYFELFRHTVASNVSLVDTLTNQLPLPVALMQTQNGQTVLVPTSVVATLSANLIANARATDATRVWDGELNLHGRIDSLFADRLELFAGFRYFNLDEELTIGSNTTLNNIPDPVTGDTGLQFINPNTGLRQTVHLPAQITASSFDRISVHNQFYGAQIGADGEWNVGRFFVNTTVKVAVGDMHQTANVQGSLSATTSDGQATFVPAGLLSQPSDVGRHSRDRIGLITEADVNMGLWFTRWLRGYVGYNFMYVQQVLRPGNQIAPAQLSTSFALLGANVAATQTHPGFQFNETNLWLQGINFGLEFRY